MEITGVTTQLATWLRTRTLAANVENWVTRAAYPRAVASSGCIYTNPYVYTNQLDCSAGLELSDGPTVPRCYYRIGMMFDILYLTIDLLLMCIIGQRRAAE